MSAIYPLTWTLVVATMIWPKYVLLDVLTIIAVCVCLLL